MDIKCPHCGTEYEIDKQGMHRYTKCEVCGKGFVAGATTALSKENPVKEGKEDKTSQKRLSVQRQTSVRTEIHPSALPSTPSAKERNTNTGNKNLFARVAGIGVVAILLLAALLLFVFRDSALTFKIKDFDDESVEIAWSGKIVDSDTTNYSFPQYQWGFDSLLSAVKGNGKLGMVYVYSGFSYDIEQIFPGKGAMVSAGNGNRMFVLTSQEYEADGDYLRAGGYIYCGTVVCRATEYKWHTVRVFKEMDTGVFKAKMNEIKKEVGRNEAECAAERERRQAAAEEERRRRAQAEEEERRRIQEARRKEELRVRRLNSLKEKSEAISATLSTIQELKGKINGILTGKTYPPFVADDAKEMDASVDVAIENMSGKTRFRLSEDNTDEKLDAEFSKVGDELARLEGKLAKLQECRRKWIEEQCRREEFAKASLPEINILEHFDIHEIVQRHYPIRKGSVKLISSHAQGLDKDILESMRKGEYLKVLSAMSAIAGKGALTKFPNDDEILELTALLYKYNFTITFKWEKMPPSKIRVLHYEYGSPEDAVKIIDEDVLVSEDGETALKVTLESMSVIYPQENMLSYHEFKKGNRPWDKLAKKENESKYRWLGTAADGSGDESLIRQSVRLYADFSNEMQKWLHPPKYGLSIGHTERGVKKTEVDIDTIYERFLERQNARKRRRTQSIRDRGMLDFKGPITQ